MTTAHEERVARSEWNFLDPSGWKNLVTIWRNEAQRMLDLATPAGVWEAPTASGHWQVRDIIGHMVDTTEGYFVSFDVERTVRFYQELLEFPLIEIFENRDYRGSSHFFFDIGHGNLLAFFDFPGLDLGPYAEVLGGLHHLALSIEPETWERLMARLDEAGVAYQQHSTSLYFRDPDGVRLELIADPLGEMYGTRLLQPT